MHITDIKLFDKASNVSQLYGFKPVDEVFLEFKGVKKTPVSVDNRKIKTEFNPLSNLVKFYIERKLHLTETPLFVYSSTIDRKTKPALSNSKKPQTAEFTLTAIGVDDPFVEAMLVSCATTIFNSLKSKKNTVRVNSMGNRANAKEYFSSLDKIIQKNKLILSPECLRAYKECPIEAHPLIFCDDNHCDIAAQITPTLRLLSDPSKEHFYNLLEYLKSNNFEYELASELVEDVNYGNDSVFEITSEGTPLNARGGRYDSFVKQNFRRNIPVSSITISIPEKSKGTYVPKATKKRKSKLFLVHSGENARYKSLNILSKLCEKNIQANHRLYYKRIDDQLGEDGRNHGFNIIFGQEESDIDALRFKNCTNNSSEVLPIDKCIEFIKKNT